MPFQGLIKKYYLLHPFEAPILKGKSNLHIIQIISVYI